MTNFEPLLTVETVAKMFGGMHPKTLMGMARRGEVPGIKIGRYWYFRASALNSWLEVNSTGQPLTSERTQ